MTRHHGAGSGGEYRSVSRLWFLTGNRSMSWLRDQIVPAVLECANCSLHTTVGAAISETVTTVSQSTVLRLSLLPGSAVICEWGSGRAGGARVVWLTGLTCRAFTRDQMTRHSDDYHCSAEVRGSFQKTAPRKTAKNTVKHRDGGVGSVVANGNWTLRLRDTSPTGQFAYCLVISPAGHFAYWTFRLLPGQFAYGLLFILPTRLPE